MMTTKSQTLPFDRSGGRYIPGRPPRRNKRVPSFYRINRLHREAIVNVMKAHHRSLISVMEYEASSRPRSLTISSSSTSSSEDQAVALKTPNQFNRTLSFITRMKEGNKRKRKARQIAVNAEDIVKTGFVKIGPKAKRFYGVLKDEWMYLYKKQTDTCTVDAYDMPSYVVSANVGSDSINIKNQKLSISLEHKMTGDVTVMTSEKGIEIFDWAEKLQKASKDQGLQMAGLNLEHGMGRKTPGISAPTMHQEDSLSQSSESRDDQLAELHRHRLIKEAMRENQQIILGTQTLKESPEQFPLSTRESPSLQRKKDKLETKYMKATEEEEQQAMIDLTILKRRRISTQVKQDTILKQLEDRKQKKKKKQRREEEETVMRKQLDELNAKLNKINSDIHLQSQHKEQKLKAIKERKELELQVLEQQNQLLRYRKATQEALENIMENAPVQRMSVPFSEESSDANSDTDSPREERSYSQLSNDSIPGISLQRPSIDAGTPGHTVIIQRSSLELQIGSPIEEEPLQSHQALGLTNDNPHHTLEMTLQGDSKNGGSQQSKTKRRLLPVIPGSPHSSRSNSRANTPSGSESENELKISETAESKHVRGSSPRTEVRGANLAVPGSGYSSPTTSDSGSESPRQGRYRKKSEGRSLPIVPNNSHKRLSKDSTSSMDIASDESPQMTKKLNNHSHDVTDNGHREQSDTNGNVRSSQTIYLRHTEGRAKTKPRPMSEGAIMHRIQVPDHKKKQRSASDSQGLRSEVSPDVLRDIEEFELMARKALRDAGWQIPI